MRAFWDQAARDNSADLDSIWELCLNSLLRTSYHGDVLGRFLFPFGRKEQIRMISGRKCARVYIFSQLESQRALTT